MIANDTTARRINASHSIQFILSTRELKRRNPDHHDNPRRRQLRARRSRCRRPTIAQLRRSPRWLPRLPSNAAVTGRSEQRERRSGALRSYAALRCRECVGDTPRDSPCRSCASETRSRCRSSPAARDAQDPPHSGPRAEASCRSRSSTLLDRDRPVSQTRPDRHRSLSPHHALRTHSPLGRQSPVGGTSGPNVGESSRRQGPRKKTATVHV